MFSFLKVVGYFNFVQNYMALSREVQSKNKVTEVTQSEKTANLTRDT